MFHQQQQQQKRTIRSAVSKGSGIGSSGASNYNIVHGILAFVLFFMAVVGVGMYLTVMSTFQTTSSSTPRKDSVKKAAASVQQQVQVEHVEMKKAVDVAAPLQKAVADADAQAASTKEVLVLKTKLGSIKIVLRPDLSSGSVDYIHRMIAAAGSDGSCPNCRLYRAEKPGILQGILRKDVTANTVKGSCPPGSESVPNDCPKWDAQCGCHGPVMTKGMVGWAAGTAGGQDFFIDNYPNPAKWWGTQHTVWGEIQDAESFALIDKVWDLPAKRQGGLTYLDEPLHFTVALE